MGNIHNCLHIDDHNRRLLAQETLKLNGMPTLDLQGFLYEIKENPKGFEECKADISNSKKYKPVSNYDIELIPCRNCKCKTRGRRRRHFQYVQIAKPRWSALDVSDHIKMVGLHRGCILWFDEKRQEIIDKIISTIYMNKDKIKS